VCLCRIIIIVGASCADDDLSMNSKCYRKFDRQLKWYSASNDCLSHGGSLAVFTDIGRPSDNSRLTNWLNTSGTDKSYWIGLVRSRWKITDKGDVLLSCSWLCLFADVVDCCSYSIYGTKFQGSTAS